MNDLSDTMKNVAQSVGKISPNMAGGLLAGLLVAGTAVTLFAIHKGCDVSIGKGAFDIKANKSK